LMNQAAVSVKQRQRPDLLFLTTFCPGENPEKLRIFEFPKETLASTWLFLYNTLSIACQGASDTLWAERKNT